MTEKPVALPSQQHETLCMCGLCETRRNLEETSGVALPSSPAPTLSSPGHTSMSDGETPATLGGEDARTSTPSQESTTEGKTHKGNWAGMMATVLPCGHTNAQHMYHDSGDFKLARCPLGGESVPSTPSPTDPDILRKQFEDYWLSLGNDRKTLARPNKAGSYASPATRQSWLAFKTGAMLRERFNSGVPSTPSPTQILPIGEDFTGYSVHSDESGWLMPLQSFMEDWTRRYPKGGPEKKLANRTQRESELLVDFAKRGVHPTELDKKVSAQIARDAELDLTEKGPK